MLQSRDFAIRYESGGTKQYLYIKFNCTADCIKLRKKYLLWFVLHCTALADKTEPKFIWMTSCEEVIHSILQVPVICDCRKEASRVSDYSQVCKRMHPLIHSYPPAWFRFYWWSDNQMQTDIECPVNWIQCWSDSLTHFKAYLDLVNFAGRWAVGPIYPFHFCW